ncbi:MAG: YiiD C-terminal domain-containing protein [Rudaea sp.]
MARRSYAPAGLIDSIARSTLRDLYPRPLMTRASKHSSARIFLHKALDEIPLTRAMQIVLRDYDGDRLSLSAPLAPNVNDKGCAFGGSLASLLTLAAWGLIALKLETRGRDCDIYVQDSTIRYLAPLRSELIAHAELAAGESWDAFATTLDTRGRARLRLACAAPIAEGGDACTLDARFVAIVRKAHAAG